MGKGKQAAKAVPATDDAGLGIDNLLKKLDYNSAAYSTLLTVIILALLYVLAFSARLFSVLRYESVIHEFDPYFNYRTTMKLVNDGYYEFLNWFDPMAWYPLGRIVGGTLYPGLMLTAGIAYWTMHFLHITVDIRNVCVLLAPWFASNTTLVTYFFAREAHSPGAGLLAAAFISIVPGYISRSVAGSYDNEGVAIFALILTYFLWLRSVHTGSMLWSGLCAVAYFYMVAAWGGYVFIINLLPLHVILIFLAGRFNYRVYVAYSTFYAMGTLLSMNIPFVGFQPVQSSEHMGAFGVFVLCQLFLFGSYIKSMLSPASFKRVIRLALIGALSVVGGGLLIGLATGYISPWTGRFYALLDPTYAKAHIPIIASVSEHQPTTWASFFFDLHLLSWLFPAGLYFCCKNPTEGHLFLVLYGITSVYFAGVMVRLMLVLAPIACVLGAVALSSVLEGHIASMKTVPSRTSAAHGNRRVRQELSLFVVVGITVLLYFFVTHCSWVTSEAYSSPSIVLGAIQNGVGTLFDDYREAYYWLRMNTPEDARVMSWWDYGYQLSAIANRTTLVDNNTWNNSHIAQVGKAMSGSEDTAIEIIRDLDVDYILAIFGGLIGYSSDDINKFLWMVRIAGSTDPSVQEADYYSSRGQYTVDASASPKMLDSLMYKMCYYRFNEVATGKGIPTAFDRVRNVEIGRKNINFKYIEEAFTSEHWIVRIYRVLPPHNRG